MISLETAKKLKEAGLKWEPKDGDAVYFDTVVHFLTGEIRYILFGDYPTGANLYPMVHDLVVYAPRLDQLLAEIEARGQVCDIGRAGYNIKYYYCALSYPDCQQIEFTAPSPGEAAAAALLWILKQEAPILLEGEPNGNS